MALMLFVLLSLASGPEVLDPPAAAPGMEQAVPEGLVPPRPLGPLEIPLPAPAPDRLLQVRLVLVIDETGAVSEATLVEGVGEPWDGAVLEAARTFRFEAATYDGIPVAVEIPFEHRFLPAPSSPEEEQALAVLEGRVVEKGSLRPVVGATVEAAVGEEVFRTRSGENGTFRLEARDGQAKVQVVVTGYQRFMVHEALREGEAVEVRYLVERERYDPYETTVVARSDRKEVSRTSLRDREIRQVPGTFGDPFRVVGALPGVTQVASLVTLPVVRGSNPGSSGFLIDGIRVPQLFHFLAGPAVVHPAFIDRVDFYPGNFPVEYGGYTGGIVDGVTRPARRDEGAVDLGVDLVNSSLFLRQPVFGATGTVAGRYGYPGLLLSAFSDEVYTSYWDYQGRLDGGTPSKGWTIFAFGSHDEVGQKVSRPVDGPEEEPIEEIGSETERMGTAFHRLDLRYREAKGRSLDLYRLTFGTDRLFGGDVNVRLWSIEPRARWERPLTESLTLRIGTDLLWRRSSTAIFDSEILDGIIPDFDLLSAGVYSDFPLWIGKDLLLTPGFRIDAYETGSIRQASFDPRFLARYRVLQREDSAAWLKGGIGIYHQPPRFPIPLPGAEELGMSLGLSQATQMSLGGEWESPAFSFDVQGFFNHMDPIFLEPSLHARSPVGEEQEEEGGAGLSKLLRKGRSFGVEFLVRKRGPGPLFGWISYTLSRAERLEDGVWGLYEFDRTHILNAVAGIQLPRNWELGGRFQVQGGRPGSDGSRLPPFTRLDLRIDRRVVYKEWMLDFYIDVINVMVTEEVLDSGAEPFRYLLPTVGFRAVL